jgi:hypothetical protein
VIGVVFGVALGFGIAWIVFAGPFTSVVGKRHVEREVAKASGAGYATCAQRQYPTSAWDCTTPHEGELAGSCTLLWTVEASGGRMRTTSRSSC